MPFGLKNAPTTFQRLIDLVSIRTIRLRIIYLYGRYCHICRIIRGTREKRKYNLLIGRLRRANLKLQPDKCEFLKTEVIYLRHVISKDGIRS